MNLSIFKYSFYSFSIAFLLCGCASYRVKPLRKLTKETAQYTQEKNNIQVCASRLQDQEFKEYTNDVAFSDDSKLMPILMTVNNNSRDILLWCVNDIQLPILSASDVEQAVFIRCTPAIVVGVASYLATATAGVLMLKGAAAMESCCYPAEFVYVCTMSFGFATMFFGSLVAFVAGTLGASAAHKCFEYALFADLHEKMLSNVTVLPNGAVSKLFVAREWDLAKPFAMSMRTLGTEKTTEFIIDLSTQDHNRD